MTHHAPREETDKGLEPGTRPHPGFATSIAMVFSACLGFFPAQSPAQTGSPTSTPASIPAQHLSHRAPRSQPIPPALAPPSGQSWHLQADDPFAADTSIHQALWNGGTGGGMPPGFCRTPATSCGYTGEDCNSYFGTYPHPPYETIDRGVGLAIQATHAPPGDRKYHDNQMADIQSYGKITIHPGSFVQWQARMPTDRHGEGDGWHIDLWCAPLSRHECDNSSEVDVAEKILSVASSSKAHFIVHDQPMGLRTPVQVTYSAPGDPDLSAGFHTYGLYWRRDHQGKQGSFEAYIDGQPIVDHPVPVHDPSWGSGAYCYAGWMQQELGVWGGGAALGPRTSPNDPLYIRRFTVWKAY